MNMRGRSETEVEELRALHKGSWTKDIDVIASLEHNLIVRATVRQDLDSFYVYAKQGGTRIELEESHKGLKGKSGIFIVRHISITNSNHGRTNTVNGLLLKGFGYTWSPLWLCNYESSGKKIEYDTWI